MKASATRWVHLCFLISLLVVLAGFGAGKTAATPEETKTAYLSKPESRARSAQQAAAKSRHWLMGKWIGIAQGQWCEWDATIRITSYDQATQTFTGDGYLLLRGECGINPSRKDLVIKGVIDDQGRVVWTNHESGGAYAGTHTFNLKRERDGHLSGRETHGGPARLTLEKQQ